MSISVSEKPVGLDTVLEKFSIYQRYHLEKIALIFIAHLANSIHCNQYIFVTEAVTYRCIDSQNFSETPEICGKNVSQSCSHWVYQDPDSFVAQFDLACEDWKRTMVGTAHNVGYMIGLLIVGPLSDKFGRKNIAIMTGVLGGVFGVLRSFSNWYWLFVAMEFMEALIGDMCSPMFVLTLEIVSSNKRLVFNMLVSYGYIVGGVLLAVFSWLIQDWRWLLRALYTPALLFILYIFFLDESPRWHLSKGRKEEATAIVEKIAAKNNIKLDQNMLDNLSYEKEENKNLKKILASTLKSRKLRTRFFVCVIWWMTSTFVNYGMVLNSVSLQGNKYVNFGLTQLVDVPGLLIITNILLRFKRKKPLIICFALGAVMCLAQPFVPQDIQWLSITFYMIGKLMSSFYFAITYLYTSELFPTYTRNSMHALCSSLGRVGSILAQQTPLLLVYWSGLPSFVFGSVALFAAFVTLLAPDISDNSLPDNVKEAEAIGKKDKVVSA
ncbi:solute carrier family 22 member 1-like isoform X1 [Pieris brassicae]|uniref:solute carrier family 22 member 1-like isoform X1 n=1 Tax=Pieris brassicae TaxID=7116 RepID=UPI001E65E758|nr:solute carrier family 22 member 1-like isoform X1 [Pieris brassicae]